MESTPAGRPAIASSQRMRRADKGENGDRNGDGNRESGPAGTEQRRERRRWETGASGGVRGNWRTLVGYVYPYRTSYEWEGAD